jgi:hypothetical protein
MRFVGYCVVLTATLMVSAKHSTIVNTIANTFSGPEIALHLT